MTKTRSLYMVSRIPGVAGPASFQRRFMEGVMEKQVQVEFGWPEVGQAEAVMIIGGTRQLSQLRRIKRHGIPLIQRLNGMNWIHRRRWTGITHFLRAELNNLLLRQVRRQADVIVYQSQFAQRWWERETGVAAGQAAVVYNGVPLERYTPAGPEEPPEDHIQLAVIEGRIGGGYEIGMDWAVELTRRLQERLDRRIKLVVAGAADQSVRSIYPKEVQWLGLLPPEKIPGLHRSSHCLFAADLHPACPNSVLEAMACGTPVAAFATGAIPELVDENSGAVVPYGANPWLVEAPDIAALVEATIPLIQWQSEYRAGARRRAEQAFGLESMVAGYLSALGWS